MLVLVWFGLFFKVSRRDDDNDNDDEDDDSIQFIGIGIRLISNDFSTILVCAQNQCCIQEM